MTSVPTALPLELRSGKSFKPQSKDQGENMEKGINAKMIGGEKTNEENGIDEDDTHPQDNIPYPNHSDDPNPIRKNSTKAQITAHKTQLKEYTQTIFAAYQKSKMRGEVLWQDFITAFRPHTIRSWPRATIIEWKDLLTQRGIFIDPDRKQPPAEAIIELLYRIDHMGIKTDKEKPTNKQYQVEEEQVKGEAENDERKSNRNDKLKLNSNKEVYQNEEYQSVDNTTKLDFKEKEDPGDEEGDNDSSSDKEERRQNKSGEERERPEADNNIKRPTDTHTESSYGNSDGQRGRGVTTIIKAYQGQPTFSGVYDEDLETVVELYSETAENCDATPEEKRKAMFIMLKGNARSLFAKKGKPCKTFEDGIELLRTWFNSTDKESRILAEWHSLSLTTAIREKPEESEVTIFRSFVDKLMSLQYQLHEDYHTDRYLRDRLMTAVDIPSINESLKDRVPRNAQQLVNRVANRLSGRKNSSSSTDQGYIAQGMNHDKMGDMKDEAMYSIGQSYGGEAKRPVKRYGGRSNQGQHQRPNTYRKHQGNSSYQQNRNRRFSSNWLRGIKGCFVCRKDHFAREKHSREEITAAIEKLKKEHPKALVAIEDVAFLTTEKPDEEDDHEENAHAEWAEEDTDDEESEGSLAYVADQDMQNLERRLSNSAFVHGISTPTSKEGTIKAMHTAFIGTEIKTFKGIRIDTCCNLRSIISRDQYNAYCEEFGLESAMKPPSSRKVTGIGGTQIPIGGVEIQIPFDKLGIIIEVDFIVLNNPVPTLLSMKDMITNGLDISIQGNYISFNGKKQHLKLENYFLIHEWSPNEMQFALYTEPELRKIHKSFGHPTISATEGLLRRANKGNLDSETRDTIARISKECVPCGVHGKAPRRFKLTVGTDGLKFNHSVQVDTMFINSKPVLHMVDLATHFSAASFLRNQTSSEVWRTIQNLWNLVYVGPPDHLSVDQGSNYISKEMRQNLEAAGVVLHEAPVENPGTIGTVERYHAPLRVAYLKIRMDLGKEVTDAECLKMAVFSVNSTIGPEGLCPILLVFGVIPRPARTSPSINQLERSHAIESARVEIEKEHAKRRIAFGLKTRGGPEENMSSDKLRNLPAGSKVLVYRLKTKQWEGPHTYISIDGETVVVQTRSGRAIFRSSCVKPVIESRLENAKGYHIEMNKADVEVDRAKLIKIQRRGPMKGDYKKEEFIQSRQDELTGLLKNGTFIAMDKSNVPEGIRIFGSRFIDEIKKAGEGLRRKSRLVAQNYSDEASTSIATRAPTIQRSSQRILLSIAASMPQMVTFSRDITQAYIQSDLDLEREVYIHAPSEMELPDGTVLKVVRPLYGIPESGLHWYLTYLNHHKERLGMIKAVTDPCMLIRHDENGILEGIIVLQVDDSLGIGTTNFLEEEDKAAQNFKTKPRTNLSDRPIDFNGSTITRLPDGGITMKQTDKIDKVRIPTNQAEFTSQRAMIQYIGVNTRPDVCASVQLIAPGADPSTAEEFSNLSKTIMHLRKTRDEGLKFRKLNMNTMRLVVITDASFANARGLKSQLGFVIMMIDDDGIANIVHYGSSRCKRVTRSVMASEIHALILGYDQAFVIKHVVEEILGRKVILEAYVDSKTVFDVVAKDGKTTEKRLQIDINALRESYAEGELSKLAWIPGDFNPADPLTKQLVNTKTALWNLMINGTVRLDPIGWSVVANKMKTSECRETHTSVCLQHEGREERRTKTTIGSKNDTV